jgi:hypothetical protein
MNELSSARRLLAAYGCLALAWAFALPPFSGPDEWSHYLRALGIAHAHLLGAPVESYHDANLDPRQEAWVAQAVRWIEVPPGMAPDGYGCNAFRPTVSAACADRLPPPPAERVRRLTVQGTYQPTVYLLPALFVRAARGPVSGLLLCRIANVLTCLALLGAAVRALRPHLVGVLVAVTPMTIFLAASFNPSGPEVAGAVAFLAGLLSLARGSAAREAWIAAAAGGAALCLSRSLGPIWLVLLGAVWLVFCGATRAWQLARAAPRRAAWTAGIIAAAAALNRAWEMAYGPHWTATRTEPVSVALRQSLRAVPGWIREQIGVYQYLDSAMPGFAYLLWMALVLGLVVAGMAVGARRDRLAVAAAVAIAIVIPVLLHALVMRPIAWVVQGRHVLPLSVAVPLVAAEPLTRDSRPLARALNASAPLCALVHLVGFYSDGRRSAVGTAGSWLFPFRFEWSPALGWWPWLVLAAVGAALLTSVREETT